LQITKNKNDSNIKENKRNNIKSKKDYNPLLFKESGLNIVEMKHHIERNKLLTKKNLTKENAMILNGYYTSVITLQKEEINTVIVL